MTQAQRYNIEEWRKYRDKIYIALRGDLRIVPRGDKDPFNERDFLQSCFKQLGELSEKQIKALDNILARIFR